MPLRAGNLLAPKTIASLNWLYPLGFLGIGFASTLFSQWIVYFHAPPGSTSQASALIGTVLLVTFLLQGLYNPLLGHLADRLRHPRGRRLPFVIGASLPLALVFYGLWQAGSFWFQALLIGIYGLLFVSVVQPYVALLPTLAPTQAMRVRYSLAGGLLSLAASGLALIGGPLLLEKGSFAWLGLIGGSALVVTVFIPSLLLRDKIEPLADPTLPSASFGTQARGLLRNKTFKWFLIGNACVVLTVTALTLVSPFLTEALLLKERAYTSVLNRFVFGGVLIVLAFISLRGPRLSFVRLLQFLALGNGLLLLGLFLASLGGGPPLLVWQLGFVSIGGLVLAGMMAPTLVLSTFSDQDEQTRTGLIFGLNGLAINCASALSSQASTALLALGNHAAHPLGVQLVLLFAAVSALGGALALRRAVAL